MNILHIDSSISGEASVSRYLSAAAVAEIAGARPEVNITYRDLVATPLDHYLTTDKPGNDSKGSAFSAIILDEFLAADTVVLGTGFYNFGIPSQLKAWIDRLAIAGKTFHYTEQGPVGLVRGKRVVIAIARGGFYGPGTPTASFEHAESYLKSIFAFLGISDIEVVAAEGMAAGPEARQAAISQAKEKIAALRA